MTAEGTHWWQKHIEDTYPIHTNGNQFTLNEDLSPDEVLISKPNNSIILCVQNEHSVKKTTLERRHYGTWYIKEENEPIGTSEHLDELLFGE